MTNVMKISEAASIGLHTMVLLAAHENSLHSAKELASRLNVSEAHLAKVLQRLSRGGLVKSIRGPKGGFRLGRPSKDISLLNVFESIEGPINFNPCLIGNPVCAGNGCIFGDVLELGNQMFRQYMSATKLSMLTSAFKKGGNRDRKKSY